MGKTTVVLSKENIAFATRAIGVCLFPPEYLSAEDAELARWLTESRRDQITLDLVRWTLDHVAAGSFVVGPSDG